MNRFMSIRAWYVIAGLAGSIALSCVSQAEDQPQWGQRHTRNMVSQETGLPDSFDPKTGANVTWTAPLGDNAYASPVVASGKVFIGANNSQPRDPRIDGDYAVLLCLNESGGALCWQLAVPRIGGDKYLDWPMIGMCSPPTVEGDRVYTMTNRFEVVCLDIDGQADGNDGPYLDEGQHMALAGQPPFDVTPTDADIIWLVDLQTAVGMYPHDGAHCSILLDGSILYLNTCNGVDNTHAVVRKPDAPSLIALDKETGRVLAQDGERIGPRIFHATWSSPALAEVNGAKQVVFGGADGVVYAFESIVPVAADRPPATMNRIWRFDCDPAGPKENVSQYLNNREVSPSIIESMPVAVGNRVYVTAGGDIWWGKKKSWLKCIDATQSGDITSTGEIWSFEMQSHCCTTPSVSNGLVFVADCAGLLHCLDAGTGQLYWSHDTGREVWASPLVADGKVYVGTRGKDFWVLAAEKELRVISSVRLGAPISATATAANGVLYVSTLEELYAIQKTSIP